jgi:hypothetical protein
MRPGDPGLFASALTDRGLDLYPANPTLARYGRLSRLVELVERLSATALTLASPKIAGDLVLCAFGREGISFLPKVLPPVFKTAAFADFVAGAAGKSF